MRAEPFAQPGSRRAVVLPTLGEDGTDWRKLTHAQRAEPHITVSLWRDTAQHERQFLAPVLSGHYTIEVLLRNTIVDCYRDGRRITKVSGAGDFGGTQVSSPGEEIRCRFRRPVEAVHVFVPRAIVVAAYEDLRQCSCPPEYQLADPAFASDIVMAKLGCALFEAATLRSPFAELCCESLGTAILARALEFQNECSERGVHQGLSPWRMKRVLRYVEANLGQPISLTDMAESAGFSRMHFAAQFKLATGLSPHAFLTEKRLDAAKSLLVQGSLSIAQVAAAVGFHTQAHFTTVFHKSSGLTPKRWCEQASHSQLSRKHR